MRHWTGVKHSWLVCVGCASLGLLVFWCILLMLDERQALLFSVYWFTSLRLLVYVEESWLARGTLVTGSAPRAGTHATKHTGGNGSGIAGSTDASMLVV